MDWKRILFFTSVILFGVTFLFVSTLPGFVWDLFPGVCCLVYLFFSCHSFSGVITVFVLPLPVGALQPQWHVETLWRGSLVQIYLGGWTGCTHSSIQHVIGVLPSRPVIYTSATSNDVPMGSFLPRSLMLECRHRLVKNAFIQRDAVRVAGFLTSMPCTSTSTSTRGHFPVFPVEPWS